MPADNELPIWTFRANWSDPIIERLGWLTDVLPSSYGTEQRRALRLSPRREFEVKFNPTDEARSYFELWLHRLGSDEFMLPLYHDTAKLAASVLTGAVTLPIDTTYREFVAGGMAVIMGADPFTCDVVEVSAVAVDGLTVTGVTKAWPKGSVVHPLRRSRLDQASAVSALTSHVGDATLAFQLNQGNDIPNEGGWNTVFGGYPILTDKPNRRENIDLDFERNSLILDNDHGLRELGDDAGRAFTVQSHMTMQKGRAEHWAFRQMLYRLRGQQGAIWIPSYNRDVRVSQPYTTGDAELAIKKIGYEYTGGAVSGRRFVCFTDGTIAEISDVGAAPSATEESLVLADSLADDLPAGLYGSFMDTCRLASDQVEITHHTSTDGAAECNLIFRSFRDERTIPDPIAFPIPYAIKSVDNCGAPADAGCVPDDLGDGSTGPATDGTGDPAGYVPGPGEPGYFSNSQFLAIHVTNYAYSESDLPHTGGDVGDESHSAPTSLAPGDIAGWSALHRDLMVRSGGTTRPLVDRDFPVVAGIDGAHTHISGDIPFYTPLETLGGFPDYPLVDANPMSGKTWANEPWPQTYAISFKWINDGTTDKWEKLFTLSVEDPGAFIAANGGPYTETVEYWPTHPGSPDPQIKKVTGYGCVVGFGEASLEHAWIADDIDPVFGYGWYQVLFYNFVKLCPRIGLVE